MKSRNNFLIIGVCICSLWTTNVAQQQTLYSQYMYSLFSINPAYAGNKDNMQFLLTERNQWTGIEGAPHSQSLIFHAPFKNQKMGYGLNLFNESIGAHGTFGVFGSYSYSIKSPEGAFSFGLRAGFYSYRIDASKVTYRDQNDPNSLTNIQSNFTPSIDAGVHYYKNKVMSGITVSNLSETKIKFATESTFGSALSRHLFAYAGYLFELNSKWKFQPSTMLKFTQNAPFNVDFNANFTYNNRFALGASYRTNQSFVLMTQVFLSKNFRLGYSLDFETFLKKSSAVGLSHEIVIGYDLNRKSPGIMNPRYL